MAIQFKRALTCNKTLNEAIKSASLLSGENALKLSEPLVIRYSCEVSDRYRYVVVICTKEYVDDQHPAELTILPSFDDLDDFINHIRELLPECISDASDLEYVFNNSDLSIAGDNQKDFNDSVINILETLDSRLTWKVY